MQYLLNISSRLSKLLKDDKVRAIVYKYVVGASNRDLINQLQFLLKTQKPAGEVTIRMVHAAGKWHPHNGAGKVTMGLIDRKLSKLRQLCKNTHMLSCSTFVKC